MRWLRSEKCDLTSLLSSIISLAKTFHDKNDKHVKWNTFWWIRTPACTVYPKLSLSLISTERTLLCSPGLCAGPSWRVNSGCHPGSGRAKTSPSHAATEEASYWLWRLCGTWWCAAETSAPSAKHVYKYLCAHVYASVCYPEVVLGVVEEKPHFAVCMWQENLLQWDHIGVLQFTQQLQGANENKHKRTHAETDIYSSPTEPKVHRLGLAWSVFVKHGTFL